MKAFNRFLKILFVILILAGVGIFVVTNYSWVFAKRVKGRILDVERVTAPSVLGGRATEAQLHSYAILIQGEDGRLYTTSSDDRQWQVAKKGFCVEALLYRYPPWDFDHANTFFNARVEELKICPGEKAPTESELKAPDKPLQPDPVAEPAVPESTPAK